MLSAKGVAYGLEAYELGIKQPDLLLVLNSFVNDPQDYTLVKLLAALNVKTMPSNNSQEVITEETYNNLSFLNANKNFDHVFWTLMGLVPGAKGLIYNLKTAIDTGTTFEFLLDNTECRYIKGHLLDIKNTDSAIAYLKLLVMYEIIDSRFISPLITAIELDPGVNWKDAISKFQLGSKNWMTSELIKLGLDLRRTALMGGWVGTQAKMLIDNGIPVTSITSYDLDTDANLSALVVNAMYPHFNAEAKDIYNVDYSECNTVINAICEHIPDFSGWYDKIEPGTLVILQNNNMIEAPDHINCVHSLEEFSQQVSLSTKLYAGEYRFMNWSRFMIIGYK